MLRPCVLALAMLIGGCGKSPDPPPDILKPYRPALETAKGIEKQLERRIDDLKRREEDPMKDDVK